MKLTQLHQTHSKNIKQRRRAPLTGKNSLFTPAYNFQMNKGPCKHSTKLIDLVDPENFTFKSSINYLKIQIKIPTDQLFTFYKNVEAEFHTYQLQENKGYRIVI